MMPIIKNMIIKPILLWCCLCIGGLVFSQNKQINSGWQYSENQTHWETVNIPHTWNQWDAFDDKPGYRRGMGYYKKLIFIPSEEETKVHYLKFNAVNQEANVKVNGHQVGSHKGGYTAFNFDISQYLNYGALNLVEVQVDNSHNLDIPPLDADFTFYGGIYRDVELRVLPKQHFSLKDFASDGFYVNYDKVSKEKAEVSVEVHVENMAAVSAFNKLHLGIFDADGKLVIEESEKLVISQHSTEVLNIKFPEIKTPKLWSPEHPYLYQLQLTLTDDDGNILDSKFSNLGFRWATIDPEKGFFLNGEPIKLIGVNRHQDFKDYGNAVPISRQKKDIHLIKSMGANMIRFAHYPHTRALYDLCDELGILVWTEIPIVNKVTDSKAFFETCIQMQQEHIKQYYNHPSVVMLGYMNEIFLRLAFDRQLSDQEQNDLKTASLNLAKQLESLTRQLAPNHITVMACHLNELYNDTGIADVPMLLGWNLYFGWYDADMEDLGAFLDEQHQRFPDRSLLLSEYGPGADVRIFTPSPKKFDFSTDYQAKLHQSYYQQIMDRPFMTGMAAWNFADFGSEFRGDAMPHVNQKGLVRYNRIPKDIYYWYKAVLNTNEPFIHLALEQLDGLPLIGQDSYGVQILSNQSRAQVFLNEQFLKTVEFIKGSVVVDMPFVDGTNAITVVSDEVSEEKSIDIIRMKSLDFKNFKRFGINIGAHFYFKDKEQGLTFVSDQIYKKGWFGYIDGMAFGMTQDKNQGIPHNIKGSTSEPLFQTMLEGCTNYKVDVPNGLYEVALYFVEPQIKPTDNLYNLSKGSAETTQKRRLFDIYLNDKLVEKAFDMAASYPEKYGITITSELLIKGDEGLHLKLHPILGQPVISGILIEKLQ